MMDKAQDIDLLLAKREGVPYGSDPLWWDRRLGVTVNVNTINAYMHENEHYLPEGCFFDEAAVMVPSKEARRMLANDLAFGGWEMFNSSADLVHANPFGTRYIVEYQFFRKAGVPWRLEVMLLGQGANLDGNPGFSPLHQALWYPNGKTPTWAQHAELPIPHLSFKPEVGVVASLVGKARAVRLTLDHLREQGFLMAQACQSTYGEFWYMLDSHAKRQLYVKPRINTRDSDV
jgi:hypothetical protein